MQHAETGEALLDTEIYIIGLADGAITYQADATANFAEGISCPACIGEYSAADRARFAERQRQIGLAKARGVAHLGPEAAE